ncbi:unnamed protein product [Closterium sp. NIES-53]
MPDVSLTYEANLTANLQLTGYVDADHAGDQLVTLSSAEAEFIAASAAVREGLYLTDLLQETKTAMNGPFKLLCDNQSVIKIANKPSFVNHTKHITLRYFFVKDEIDKGKGLGGGGCVASPAPPPPSSPTAAAVAEGGGCVGVYGVVLGGLKGVAAEKPAAPVARETVAPVAREPVAPVAREPVAPVARESVARLPLLLAVEPVTPVARVPVAPVASVPVAPVARVPVAPVAPCASSFSCRPLSPLLS